MTQVNQVKTKFLQFMFVAVQAITDAVQNLARFNFENDANHGLNFSVDVILPPGVQAAGTAMLQVVPYMYGFHNGSQTGANLNETFDKFKLAPMTLGVLAADPRTNVANEGYTALRVIFNVPQHITGFDMAIVGSINGTPIMVVNGQYVAKAIAPDVKLKYEASPQPIIQREVATLSLWDQKLMEKDLFGGEEITPPDTTYVVAPFSNVQLTANASGMVTANAMN